MLGLLSPTTPGIFEKIHSGSCATQYIHGYQVASENPDLVKVSSDASDEFVQGMTKVYLKDSVSRFPVGRYKLQLTRGCLYFHAQNLSLFTLSKASSGRS